ncbi:MAG: metallophosphoesterase [Thermofilaceae archaeon]
MVAVAALSDVHGIRYLSLVKASLPLLKKAALTLLAGDLAEKGDPKQCRLVIDALRVVYKGEIIGIFGNEEYDERKKEIKDTCNDVTWLDDEITFQEIPGYSITIVGTRGVLDRPTRWQEKNIPGISKVYEARLNIIEKLLTEARQKSHYNLLLTHYAPICGTLEGENPRIWEEMGSRKLTSIIMRTKTWGVFHGHAHNSRRTTVHLGGTRVYNVAVPAVKGITLINLTKNGIEAYF